MSLLIVNSNELDQKDIEKEEKKKVLLVTIARCLFHNTTKKDDGNCSRLFLQ